MRDSPLNKILRALENLPNTVTAMMQEISRENSDELADFLTFQQLAGKRGDGQDITPKYSEVTIEMKKLKGQEWRHVTLEDEGDYHRGMVAKEDSEGIEIHSMDWKDDMLREDYGEEILIYNDDTISKVNEEIYFPELEKKIRQKIGKL